MSRMLKNISGNNTFVRRFMNGQFPPWIFCQYLSSPQALMTA
jgi:hypothetical protein